ncbi:MAG: O-unit flippase-like protein [Paludibacteraceae bacterium]
MQITKKDVAWNLGATVLKIASGVIILPVILKYLTADDVGVWTIFLSFSAITLLFDFGFSATFSRTITYIFSGANELYPRGFEITATGSEVNYALLKSTIKAMKWFYARIALVILLFLLLGGTFYIRYVLEKSYSGDFKLIYLSWILYGIIIAYQAYTLYFESLLLGKGLVKRNKQIIVISQLLFMIVSLFLLVYFRLGLLSLVIGQAVSVITNRTLSYFTFYNHDTKEALQSAGVISHKEILRNISPNAIKIGITSLGSFLVNKSAVFVGSLFLPLPSIATYGVSKQVVDMISAVSSIWFSTYYPKIIQYRVNNKIERLKSLYVDSKIVYVVLFVLSGVVLVLFGNQLLSLIKTDTLLLSAPLLILLLVVAFLENNHSIAGNILLTKNDVPFFKASILSGLLTVLLLILFLGNFKFGVISLILAQGLAQLVYQNWKWPLEVIKELNITRKDYTDEMKKIMNKLWMFRLS